MTVVGELFDLFRRGRSLAADCCGVMVAVVLLRRRVGQWVGERLMTEEGSLSALKPTFDLTGFYN